ncbi:hypothetical protein F383_26614 [Gossypium arboreum]|uniref:Uncharacterized protein n=1 Tax=Gossypium arboreum TaxID=29729 RepID=A0A0B0PB01_GOSAR|nr:hypothetical protein F383_26614 [Gossypium arboreum]
MSSGIISKVHHTIHCFA